MLLLLGVLLASSAFAEDVAYSGRTLEVAGDQEAKPIVRMQGSHYSISLPPDQVISKAQTCLAAQNGMHVESADPASGQLQATAKLPYRVRFSSYTVSSRLTLLATNGGFQITETTLGVSAAGSETAADVQPLSQKESGWEKSLDALILGENALVDCLYR